MHGENRNAQNLQWALRFCDRIMTFHSVFTFMYLSQTKNFVYRFRFVGFCVEKFKMFIFKSDS